MFVWGRRRAATRTRHGGSGPLLWGERGRCRFKRAGSGRLQLPLSPAGRRPAGEPLRERLQLVPHGGFRRLAPPALPQHAPLRTLHSSLDPSATDVVTYPAAAGPTAPPDSVALTVRHLGPSGGWASTHRCAAVASSGIRRMCSADAGMRQRAYPGLGPRCSRRGAWRCRWRVRYRHARRRVSRRLREGKVHGGCLEQWPSQ